MAKQKVISPRFRVSYNKVWRPHKNKDGSLVYGITMIYEPDADLSEMEQLVTETREDKWGRKEPSNYVSPFKDGTKYHKKNGKKNPEYIGNIIVNASSYNQPVGVGKVDLSKPKGHPKRVIEITDHAEFYSGCYAKAALTTYAWENSGRRGVSFGLQNIIKLANGEPLVKGATVADDFGEIEDDEFEDEEYEDDEYDEDDEY